MPSKLLSLPTYGLATISRLLKFIGLFCKILSLLQGFFAKQTYDFKEPTNRSHPISGGGNDDQTPSINDYEGNDDEGNSINDYGGNDYQTPSINDYEGNNYQTPSISGGNDDQTPSINDYGGNDDEGNNYEGNDYEGNDYQTPSINDYEGNDYEGNNDQTPSISGGNDDLTPSRGQQ